MNRWTFLAVMVLAGCGADSGGDAASRGGDGPPWPEATCSETHQNGAPCCPRGLMLTQEDCAEGYTLGGDTLDDRIVRECRPEMPEFHDPDWIYFNSEPDGDTRVYGIGGNAVFCYTETGFQKWRQLYVGMGMGDCVRDCYGPDGSPADCADLTNIPECMDE